LYNLQKHCTIELQPQSLFLFKCKDIYTLSLYFWVLFF
jgi:hypothetical protein